MMERIAVIGSGMAGLAAGWLCQQGGHEVTVFEAQPRRGMDAHTLDVAHAEGSGHVDVPLRVMSPHAWSNVLSLCEQVGVETFEVDTFAACSWLQGETWFRSEKLRLGGWGIPWAKGRFLFTAQSLVLLKGFWQLWQGARTLEDPDLTLREFADQQQFPPLFWKGLVLPLLTTICTCDVETLERWPAQHLLRLLQQIVHGKHLVRLRGGTRALVSGLAESLSFVSGSPVASVTASAEGVEVWNEAGDGGTFDRVISAVQANQLGFLGDAFTEERALLSRFPYASGTLWVHQDTRFMPKRPEDWAALHYQMPADFTESMFTVWVNPVEPSLGPADPVFQTWDPLFEPDPETVLAVVPLQRAVVGPENAELLERLTDLQRQPDRRVFFCGSYASAGVPLLESAVRSALTVAGQLGVTPSWNPTWN